MIYIIYHLDQVHFHSGAVVVWAYKVLETVGAPARHEALSVDVSSKAWTSRLTRVSVKQERVF